MKYPKLIVFVGCCVLLACSKEETAPNLIQSLTQLKKGNYWIYQVVKVNSNGSETILGRDSVYVEGDTTINGVRYATLNHGRAYSQQRFRQFLRDSADCLVSKNGTIALTTDINKNLASDPVVFSGNTVAVTDYRVIQDQYRPMLPGITYNTTFGIEGTFKTLTPISGVRSPRSFHTLYAIGIGRIFESYFTSSSDFKYEERLVRSSTLK
jgi:hypothetical protein